MEDDAETQRARLERDRGMNLAVKLTGWFAGCAALIVAATGLWTAHTYRASLREAVVASAERSADLIQRSARRAMLTNSREDLDFLVRTLGGQPDAARVRIGDAAGRIAFSSEPAEIGSRAAPTSEQVRFFHAPTQDDKTVPAVAVTHTLHNEPECYNAACHAHPASQQVLGVLDVHMPLDEVEANSLLFARRSLAFGALGILLIAVMALPVLFAQLSAVRRANAQWTDELQRRVDEEAAELERAYAHAGSVEKLASLGTLSAALAHEINNPLAGIRTYARWMARTMPATVAADPHAEEWKSALEMIEAESKRCGDLVRNLLTFARQTPLEMTPTDVVEVIERCVLLVRHKAQMQNVEVQWNPAAEVAQMAGQPPQVVCDGAQVQQALLAILINGIEAMPRGGVLSIAVSHSAQPRELRIEIADNGPGISDDALSHLFEPFFTTKQIGKGTGLGLSLAHGIISRHGGRIEVQAGLGHGATFTVVLPEEGINTCQRQSDRAASNQASPGPTATPSEASLSLTTNR
jgi:two-component system NtrC family sensor kinase